MEGMLMTERQLAEIEARYDKAVKTKSNIQILNKFCSDNTFDFTEKIVDSYINDVEDLLSDVREKTKYIKTLMLLLETSVNNFRKLTEMLYNSEKRAKEIEEELESSCESRDRMLCDISAEINDWKKIVENLLLLND
jgi:pyruvate carboxylase